MPQRVRGGAQAIERTYGHLDAITAAAAEGYKLAVYNQQYARKCFDDIQQIIADLRQQLEAEIEPFLERQAPQYDKRLADLEARIEQIEAGNIRLLRKAE